MTDETQAPAPTAPAPVANQPIPNEIFAGYVAKDYADGKVSLERANAELAANGLPPLPDPGTAAAEAKKVEALKATDPFYQPGTTFDLPDINAAYHAVKDTDLKAAPDRTPTEIRADADLANGWLKDGGFTPEIGRYVAKTVAEQIKAEPNYDAKPVAQREIDYAIGKSRVEKIWKGETETNTRLANQLLGELEAKHKGTLEILRKSGALNNVNFVVQVGNHARRLAIQRGIL